MTQGVHFDETKRRKINEILTRFCGESTLNAIITRLSRSDTEEE